MIIKISEIERQPKAEQNTKFEEIIEEFNDEEPVRADLKISLESTTVKISGKIKAKLKLTCDYCLEEFIRDYETEITEYYERGNVNEDYTKEYEIKENDFVEDLNGSDEIDITNLIYQIITLDMQNQIVCGINCKGKENLKKYIKEDLTDPRLEIFKQIKTKR